MEETYGNLTEVIRRILELKISRDDFDKSCCQEHERLLLKMIESVNKTIDEANKLVYGYPVEHQFQMYLNSHLNYSVSSMDFVKYKSNFYRLLAIFDVKE